MGHPDFGPDGRISRPFITMAGMVVLTPEQQQRFIAAINAAAFTPESGAWGRAGSTRVQLDAVDEDMLGDAMTLAWQNTVDNTEDGEDDEDRTEERQYARKRSRTKAVKAGAAGKPATRPR